MLGRDQDLPWHLPEDFSRFKALTSEHKIIMGRKTLETFPRPLPNREHIVVSGTPGYQPPFAVLIVSSLEEALERVGNEELAFVIGGGTIYRQALPMATHVELTRIHTEIEGDTFFPELDPSQWQLVWQQYHPTDKRHEYSFTFQHFIRKELWNVPGAAVPWLGGQ